MLFSFARRIAFSTDVLPIPLAGKFIMRFSASSSLGFTTTLR